MHGHNWCYLCSTGADRLHCRLEEFIQPYLQSFFKQNSTVLRNALAALQVRDVHTFEVAIVLLQR